MPKSSVLNTQKWCNDHQFKDFKLQNLFLKLTQELFKLLIVWKRVLVLEEHGESQPRERQTKASASVPLNNGLGQSAKLRAPNIKKCERQIAWCWVGEVPDFKLGMVK